MPYDFATQNAIGLAGEQAVWTWLSKFYRLVSATSAQQNRGIDAIGIHFISGEVETFEVKTDTHDSGNLFIEIIANDKSERRGWEYTCQADWLIYYLQARSQVMMFRPRTIARALSAWQDCPTARVPNQGYHTIGLLVPRWRAVQVADAIIRIGK